MNDEAMKAMAESLGDPERDFETDPLTNEEIHAIISVYSEEILKPDLEPAIREIYRQCLEILKNNVLFH
jgi:hypothetical protein